MIEAGVPATFIFHRAEEIGGRGSQWLADNYPEWLGKFNICLALDRRGTEDVIVSQWGGRTASDAFAESLAEALGMGHHAADGVFTDSANYAELIPECSNLSIGYQQEHTAFETLDTEYLEKVIAALCKVDWTALKVERDPRTNDWLDDWDDSADDDEWFTADDWEALERADALASMAEDGELRDGEFIDGKGFLKTY
jgi:hypothetical protein